MISPFDIIKHLSEKTPLEYEISQYNPWMVNRGFSNMMDTVFFAEAMNKYYSLDKDIQRDFLYFGIPKGKRWGKWTKQSDINNIVGLIMNKYQCNRQVAETYHKLMSPTDIKQFEEKMNTGGR